MLKPKKRGHATWWLLPIALSPLVVAQVVLAYLKIVSISIPLDIIIYSFYAVLFAFGLYKGIPIFPFLFAYIGININIILLFARAYRNIGLVDSTGVIVQGKWDTTYFSILTWTGANFGEFTPTPAARPWVIGETVAGYVSLAILVSLIVVIFQKRRKKTVPKPLLGRKRWGRYYLGKYKRKIV